MITNVLHTKCFADPFPQKILAVVNECTALHQILKFYHFPSEEFFSKCSKIFGNGAFPEYFLTRKLGEISVLNAAQELIFSKFASLQTATVLEKELHSFFHCFSAEL